MSHCHHYDRGYSAHLIVRHCHDAFHHAHQPRMKSVDLTVTSIGCHAKQRRQRRSCDSIVVYVPVRQCSQCHCHTYNHKYTDDLQYNFIYHSVSSSPHRWQWHCDDYDLERSKLDHDSHADTAQYCLPYGKFQRLCHFGRLLAERDIYRYKLCHGKYHEHLDCIRHQHDNVNSQLNLDAGCTSDTILLNPIATEHSCCRCR